MRNQIRNIAWTTLLAALYLSPQDTQGQYALDYGFAFGTGNYLGDIGGDALERRDFFPDLHHSQTKLSTHIFARYRVSSMFAVRAQLGTVYLEDYANLSTNPARRTRNTHFRNYVNELSLRGEINLFSQPMITRYTSKLRVGVNTYATLGVTGFVHNPQAQLDRDAAEYHFRLGIEFVWNLTLTDYIDDVSFTYADPEGLDDIGLILSQPSSVVAAEAASVDDPVGFLNSFRWD